jgi:hypothetical protein
VESGPIRAPRWVINGRSQTVHRRLHRSHRTVPGAGSVTSWPFAADYKSTTSDILFGGQSLDTNSNAQVMQFRTGV